MYTYEENQSFENIYSVYQPIFDLNSGRIYANESLVRGKDECFINPLDLIQYHRQEGTVHIMDSQCHQKSVESIKPHKYHQNIFMNIECITMDCQCHLEDLNRLLDENGISRSDVVLEVCERCYDIDALTLGRCFDKYIAAGYRLALDDIDVSMLGMNTELLSKCSFMKISINLIKDIDKDDGKKALLKSISSYAKFMDVRIVAEGVETLEELQCLIDLNIDFAQGYYLGKPNMEAINSDMSILKLITSLNKNNYTNDDIDSLGYSFVGQIMEKRPVFLDEIKCKEVVDLFKHSKFESLCFINKDDDIVGYINQNELFHNFSTQFGYSLYGDKPIKSIFNDSPLIVNYHFSIKQVLELAMSRPERNIYDDVIIANNGKYLGIASMRQIITKYNEIDNQHATQLNPLTSLPGNNIINNNINKYMQSDKPVLFTYVDLSDFKVYNDFYGFECGDIVLKKTADILVDRFECLPYDSFVGHIGGDDFVCMCEISIMGSKRLVIVRNMLDGIIDDFEKHKVNFYNEVDYKNGYIETANRLGKYGKCGLININLACYLGKLDCFETLEEIAEYMATIKRQSKQRNNSNYIIRYSKDNSLVDLSVGS